jgi:hypothetical protein
MIKLKSSGGRFSIVTMELYGIDIRRRRRRRRRRSSRDDDRVLGETSVLPVQDACGRPNSTWYLTSSHNHCTLSTYSFAVNIIPCLSQVLV